MPTKNEKSKKGSAKKTSKKKKEKKISYYKKPADLTLSEWQRALRIQFGKEGEFEIKNLGEHPVFSTFQLFNKESRSTYKVELRTNADTGNFCSCLDFKTNRLGICKHISHIIEKVGNKRGHKRIFKAGFEQPHSSIYVDYSVGRKIKLGIGSEKAANFKEWAPKYFEPNGELKQEGYSKFEKILGEAREIHPDFRFDEDALELVIARREMIGRNAKIDQLITNGLESPFFKKIIKTRQHN